MPVNAFARLVKEYDTRLWRILYHYVEEARSEQDMSELVDKVRRQEQKERPELKQSRYVWLTNPENLKEEKLEILERLKLPKLKLKTARAYQLKTTFQELYEQSKECAEEFLKKWYSWAVRSRQR